ncbi:MAG: winged helix-turn-helix domain-containing protein [Planctomycetota bacterium]|nr:winged helix-turn-helix domain-containing protein [Planctomycetota bacterium]
MKPRTTTRRPGPARKAEPALSKASWTFLTNHAHVLLSLARDPGTRVRDVAAAVGITERAVMRILRELEAADYLRVTREGRRNRYEVRSEQPLRHPIEAHRNVSALLDLIEERPSRR